MHKHKHTGDESSTLKKEEKMEELAGKKILSKAEYVGDLNKTIQILAREEKVGEDLQKQKREELKQAIDYTSDMREVCNLLIDMRSFVETDRSRSRDYFVGFMTPDSELIFHGPENNRVLEGVRGNCVRWRSGLKEEDIKWVNCPLRVEPCSGQHPLILIVSQNKDAYWQWFANCYALCPQSGRHIIGFVGTEVCPLSEKGDVLEAISQSIINK